MKPKLLRKSDLAGARDAFGKDKQKEEEKRLKKLMEKKREVKRAVPNPDAQIPYLETTLEELRD